MPRIIHVLLIREGDFWVAQALDVDIAAQGRTISLAQKAFIHTVNAQLRLDRVHGREPFQGIAAAPQLYWDAFFKHARDLEQTVVEGDNVLPAYMIQAIADEGALSL